MAPGQDMNLKRPERCSYVLCLASLQVCMLLFDFSACALHMLSCKFASLLASIRFQHMLCTCCQLSRFHQRTVALMWRSTDRICEPRQLDLPLDQWCWVGSGRTRPGCRLSLSRCPAGCRGVFFGPASGPPPYHPSDAPLQEDQSSGGR